MKNLKKTLRISLIAIIAVALTACGGGISIEAVKLIPVKSGKEFQYVDKEGKIVINPQFAQASVFRNGLALVQTSGDKPQWGYISEDGKYAITATYKHATVFSEDLAWVVSENTAPAAINTKGEIKFTLQNAEQVKLFHEGLAAFSQLAEEGKAKWGFVDKEGKVKINPQFSGAGDFKDGKCPVSSEGKWGYIDKEGKISINYQFDYAESFINGKAVVISGGKAGLIDANGKYLINPQFTNMQNDGDLFLVNQDGKFGWTDKEGKIIINPQFSRAFPFTGGNLAAVQSGKSYGFIDKEGKIVVNPQFDIALPFNGKLALVENANKIGFIDNEGKYVINPQFDGVSSDLVVYFETGGSAFGSVQTDFFNVGAITSRIKIDAPEGLTFDMSFTDALTKLQKTENDLSKGRTQHKLIASEKITNDASLDFYVLGNPYTTTTNGYYGYNYTLNPSSKPTGFAYVIGLNGKGFGKEDVLMTSIEQILIGYTKDATASTEGIAVYTNDKQTVKASKKRGGIEIIITSKVADAPVTEGVD